ncbi:lycopene cyclase family protein [Sediminibacter sp. Hel_I_10]|uniref:lycopene cyclase family protein n=1 Tax=Sediminibacter sp. Hel_I_10 TaxID=1392490 RepID=UPI00047D093F|nr:lycopene cyclase family protein [Sediminibacter sp. Hel_I_10]
MSHPSNHFDYIIIGNGLAGFQLALKMAQDPFFSQHDIALIDASEKLENDKSWSFWEKSSGLWDDIVHKTWQKANIKTSEKEINLNLNPYTYKTIQSIDFYNFAKGILSQQSNFSFIIEEVQSVKDQVSPEVHTLHHVFTADHVFDSRIPTSYFSEENGAINILQHFKGIFITTETPRFDPTEFTMMDYRIKDGNQTTFTYVLPFSETKALVEFTYFTSETVSETTYDQYIERYISEVLGIKKYRIEETETGIIPMTSFDFDRFSTANITKIGTAGGWVKASTGYSFKHTEKKVTQILENIKVGQVPSHALSASKYKLYDKIFLKVLQDDNDRGEWIFQQFYDKNKVQTMFRFLDEESTFLEELKIMWSLFSWQFIKAFFKTL